MRLALLTDIHGNREAMTACLEHAAQQKAERYAFTGDFVGYGGDPGWVVDTVMQHVAKGAIAVMGNHDHSVTQPTKPQMHAEARETIEWTRGQMNPEQLDFLAKLPMVVEQDRMAFVHASAFEPQKWEYVNGPVEAERSLKASRARMVFSGHVHAPALYRRADDGRMGSYNPGSAADTSAVRVPLQPQHQYLVLPGAVGQPRDGNCASCYAIYDDERREVTYYRVPYDHGAAARRVIAVGLPIVFAMRLIEGI